jgi:predicted alpha/beta superfamily hydrolase
VTNCSKHVATTPTECPAPVQLPGAYQFDTVSRRGKTYRIFVYVPPAAPPEAGFPVLYLLDGNATFATAVDTLTMQMRRPEVTGVPPSVIVGIGYPIDANLDIERRRVDYTPHTDAAAEPVGGGARDFSDFIENNLKPIVEASAPIDKRRQALFGHSLGGLFVLWSLFGRSGTFQSYMAASPSIWWEDRHILTYEAAFIERVRTNADNPRLLVTVGGLEQLPAKAISAGRQSSMVEDASALVARLRVQAGKYLHLSFVEFPDETHVSVIPAALSRSIRFAWPDV